MPMKKIILMAAIAISLASCNQNIKDYTARGTYVKNDSTQGFQEFIFVDDYVQVTYLFDSLWFDTLYINGSLYIESHHVTMASQCRYEQNKQNVTVFNAYYDVPPHEKDSDLHIRSYGDYLIHDGKIFNRYY